MPLAALLSSALLTVSPIHGLCQMSLATDLDGGEPDAGLQVLDGGTPDGGLGDGTTDPDTDTQGIPTSCNTSGDCPADFICFKSQCEPQETGGPNNQKGGFGCASVSPSLVELAALAAAALGLAARRRRRA